MRSSIFTGSLYASFCRKLIALPNSPAERATFRMSAWFFNRLPMTIHR
jgi:hypothetical protein